MKIRVTMKDPDTMHDAVLEAVTSEVKAMGLPEDEARKLIQIRVDKQADKMAKWFKFSEYLTVECDTDAMTAKVVDVMEGT